MAGWGGGGSLRGGRKRALLSLSRPYAAGRRQTTGRSAIAAIARRQHGIITFAELLACGLSQRAISHRVAAGRLHRIHRGVYAVGPPSLLSKEGVWLAAVKACGPKAVLSHQSAAQLSKLLSLADYRGPVQVTVPGTNGVRQRNGIVVHRSSALTRKDWMIRDGIPVTNSKRTLIDLRRVLDRQSWLDAVDRARSLHLPTPSLPSTAPTRSNLERRLLALCRRHRLPLPETNLRVGPFLIDFLWRNQRLIVETDGYEHHRDRASFEADRARDVQLTLMGFRVVRITWRQVRDDPAGVAATLQALLGL